LPKFGGNPTNIGGDQRASLHVR